MITVTSEYFFLYSEVRSQRQSHEIFSQNGINQKSKSVFEWFNQQECEIYGLQSIRHTVNSLHSQLFTQI